MRQFQKACNVRFSDIFHCLSEYHWFKFYKPGSDTAINQLQQLTRSRLQAKLATHITSTVASNTTNELPPHHAMAVLDETTGKMLEYRHLIKNEDPEVGRKWQLSSANEFGRTMRKEEQIPCIF
ncbi:hypothetical protein FRACYDRAFT_237403 [Fragilariopsis cylindrus CCMP1102]|uniref:Uncharacterized protein n=1 Tax=Fragilariopsis cylindrus CCMP1102 TaxID=635003 RepID=A0A1E7FLS1_9STRA|nr:hypothetical protein FRACYDRAFT_237403 [Fragilariopsis cylindrus CCMP1102]|eukprot:OEU19110.1 hypothetical protein FRACYDRAFT_237403 [Fragilariopsis cylindrus CCMP1102]